jgi:predicted N-acyltransferase
MKQEDWENLNGDSNPFLNFHFFKALDNSRCIGPGTGWGPVIIKNQDGFLQLYNKTNSHGEYIFDWSWADAYHRYGEAYYPKLTSMVPFTPVTSGHFLQKHFSEAVAHQLLDLAEEYYQAHNYSSLHFLFLTNEEKKFFEKRNYLLRESFQYHFFNQGYGGFEDFLSELKTKKAKQIRKERSFPTLKIEQITGADLSEEHAERMYLYYIRTIEEKNSFDYLNRDFFVNVFRTMKKNILMVEAYEDEKPVAASLFFLMKKNFMADTGEVLLKSPICILNFVIIKVSIFVLNTN